MKKLLSIVLLITIVASLFTTVSFAAPKGMEVSDKIQLLQEIGILPEGEEPELDKAISRGEFVKLLANLFKIDTTVQCEDRYYADLGEDDELWNITAQLVGQRILTVPENRNFRPKDIITYKEAACALMKGYGAGEMEYEMYTQIAIRMDLFEDVSYGEMKYKDVINLLFNALVGTPLTFTGNGIGPGDKTFMENKYDMFYIRGIVNAVNESAIDGGAGKPATIRVGDVTIGHKATNLYQYLGKEVGVFYTSEDDPQLVYIYDYEKSYEVIELSERNHPVFDGDTYTLKYYNENDRLKNVKLSTAVSVIINGEEATDDVIGAFEDFTVGKITLINSTNKGEYDTVVIDSYYNISIMSVSSSEGVISGKNGETIDVANDSRTVLIQDVNGNDMSLEQITEGNVASVFESDVYLKIVISTAVVSGTITKVDSHNAPIKLTVAGSEYELFPEKDFAYALGNNVSLKLDAYGYVFEISAERKDGLTYGWIVSHRMIDVEGEDRVQLKIFTEKGNFEKVTLPEKIRIDGTMRKTPDLQLFGLEQGKSSIIDQMILFKMDNNVATEIDTICSNGTGEGLFKEFENAEGTYGSSSVGKLIWADTATVVFVIPSAENREIEEAYGIGTKSLLEAWKNNEVESYRSADKDKPAAAEVLVLRRDMYDYATEQRGAYVVGDFHSEWDEQEDEIYHIVTMMNGSSTKEFVLSKNFDDMENLVKGNIVTIGVNGKKELSYATLQYGTDDEENDVKILKELGSWSDANHYVAIGKIVNVGDNYADLSIAEDGTPTVRFPISTTNIGVFEADEEKMCRVGTKGDIAEAMMRGDIVAVTMYRGTMVSIAIVKR